MAEAAYENEYMEDGMVELDLLDTEKQGADGVGDTARK